jgi:hypothetical protein
MAEMRNAYKILVQELERKRPLGRTRSGWQDNTGICRGDVEECGLESRGSG